MKLDLTDYTNVVPGGIGVGGVTSPWVSTQGNARVHAILAFNAVAETITVTATQASDSSGTGAKSLNISHTYARYGIATTFTQATVGAGNFNVTPAAAGVTVVEFDVAGLDVNANFSHIRIALTGSTTRVQSMVFLPMGGKI